MQLAAITQIFSIWMIREEAFVRIKAPITGNEESASTFFNAAFFLAAADGMRRSTSNTTAQIPEEPLSTGLDVI
jgi:hypothetical protein